MADAISVTDIAYSVVCFSILMDVTAAQLQTPDSKVHGANMGPTWVLSAPDGPHVPCSQGLYFPTHFCIQEGDTEKMEISQCWHFRHGLYRKLSITTADATIDKIVVNMMAYSIHV